MKILITGSTGLLGTALVKRLARSNELVGLSRHPTAAPTRHEVCDLADAEAVNRLMRSVKPDAVIHAQAMSDVDRCELQPQQAELMNARTVEHVCRAAELTGALVIALSTDYVFDGAKDSPYGETDPPRPISVYGRTKLAGEQVALRYARGVVVRPSTLFGPGRMNFCDAIVERCRRGEPIDAFTDQATSPTYTEDLAEALDRLATALVTRDWTSATPRLYHAANAGGCTRVQFASRIVERLGGSPALVRPIRMQDQHRPAPRPPYSVLTSHHLTAIIGTQLRPWDEALNAYLTSQH